MVPLSTAVSFVSVFPSCPRSPRYEVEDISSRVKKCDRTEGGNASALYAHRTSECGAAQRSVEDCVGMGEAGTQLHRTTTICSCPIICGVCSRHSVFAPATDGPAGLSEASCAEYLRGGSVGCSVVEEHHRVRIEYE